MKPKLREPDRRRRYYGTDIFKCFFAIVVISSHTRPWEDWNHLGLSRFMSVLTGISVIYFFLCSGYFLLKDNQELFDILEKKELLRRIKKIGFLYCIWSVIYFPITVYGEFFIYKKSPGSGILDILAGFLFRGQNYNSWFLWYILAAIVSYLMIFLLGKSGWNIQKMLYLGIGLFAAGTVLDIVHQMKPFRLLDLFYQVAGTQNGLFKGFCYIMIGVTLSRKIFRKQGCFLPVAVIAFILSWLCYDRIILCRVLAIISIAAFFVFTLSLNIPGIGVIPYADMFSKVLYYIHLLFVTVFEICGIRNSSYGHVKLFVCTLLCSVLIAVIVIKRREKNLWLKKIFF